MVNKTAKLLLGLFAVIGTTFGATRAFALDLGVCIPDGKGGQTCNVTSYLDYIRVVFKFALEAGVALTVLMIIYGGIIYLTSQGNPSALNSAKDIIIGSLSGLAMLALVVLILTFLGMPLF